MTGLALGVGFALLIIDRFRREGHAHHMEAAEAAVAELETTGRAVLVGGSAVVLGLALVAVRRADAADGFARSRDADLRDVRHRWRRGCHARCAGSARQAHRGFQLRCAGAARARVVEALDGGSRVAGRPVFAGFFATLLLAALAVPAFALSSGPQTITQLPKNAKARIAFEEVSRVMGPGMATPYNLILVAHNGRSRRRR